MNKVLVVTGAGQGLGKEIAKIFSENEYTVIISDKNKDLLTKTAKVFPSVPIVADVTSSEQVERLADEVVATCGRIDIWINNAGVWFPKTPINDIPISSFENLCTVNVFGVFNGMKAAITPMKKQSQGMVVNISSTTAFDGMNGSSSSIYVASKYAIRGLTNTIREEAAEDGITVMGVYPGGMKTALFDAEKPSAYKTFMSPEDVAMAVYENITKEHPELELVLKRNT
jgi:NAD(P)-dependent dehydrogenase (short-subunit alcohol dehydrogenase family)